MTCPHNRQIQEQAYVHDGDCWQESSLHWRCLDCSDHGIRTKRFAFYHPDCRRTSRVVRDDRNKEKQ